jgi:hypothetical protein
MPVMPAAAPAVPAELLAAYQAQLAASGFAQPGPSVPPELAAMLAALQPGQPNPALRPTSQGFVPPLKPSGPPSPAGPEPRSPATGRPFPRPSPPSEPTRPLTTRPVSDRMKPPTQAMGVPRPSERGESTGSRNRSDVLPLGGQRPPGNTPAPRNPSESQRVRAASEPLRAPTDPYANAPPHQMKPTGTTSYQGPMGGNGDSPEAREATALLSTVRALGMGGEALGSFVGDTMLKLLEEGKIAIALELAERGLDLADKGNFEQALATRMAFKTKVKNPLCAARALELVVKHAPQRGGGWASRVAQRTLNLIDPETPPDPKAETVLGKLAAIARA